MPDRLAADGTPEQDQITGLAVMATVVRFNRKFPEKQLLVAGHTDTSGGADYNQTLSENRAETVKKYMVENGVEEANLSVVGYGETQPIANNKTAKGRALNRRIEIALQPNLDELPDLSSFE